MKTQHATSTLNQPSPLRLWALHAWAPETRLPSHHFTKPWSSLALLILCGLTLSATPVLIAWLACRLFM